MMNASLRYEDLTDRIVECLEIADQLTILDPVTTEIRAYLRLAYDCTMDRALAIKVQGRQDKGTGAILRQIHVDRTRQPRRGILRWLGRLG